MLRISGFSAFFSVRFPHRSRIKRFSMPMSSARPALVLDPAKGVGADFSTLSRESASSCTADREVPDLPVSRRLQEPRWPQRAAPVLSPSQLTGSREPTREDRVRSAPRATGLPCAAGKVGRWTHSVSRCSLLRRGSSPPSGHGGGRRATTVCRRPWQIAYAIVSGRKPVNAASAVLSPAVDPGAEAATAAAPVSAASAPGCSYSPYT